VKRAELVQMLVEFAAEAAPVDPNLTRFITTVALAVSQLED